MSNLMVRNQSAVVTKAYSAWKYLQGIVNVYKPAGMEAASLVKAIKIKISRELNTMELDDPPPIVRIASKNNKDFEIDLVPNIAQDVLSTGPRYTIDLIRALPAEKLGFNTSGVMLLGINKGRNLAFKLRHGAPIQTYCVTGKFGTSTETNFAGSLITSKATYKHVTSGRIQALLATMQATHQRMMFHMCGVDLQSQAAYELACKGLIRPKSLKDSVIYGMKCIHFNGTTFTIEVQCMNVSELILTNLILRIALELRTVAHCIKIRCTRYGFYSYENSLLRRQLNVQNIIQNMYECEKIWKEHPEMISKEISTPVGHKIDNS